MRAFARQGAHIGLLARGRAGLEGRAATWSGWAARRWSCQTDVADADQVERAAAAVETAFGPIDVWVNDAMCSVFSPVKEMTPADYKRVTEVTYLGFVYGTLAALKRMLPRDRGIIVQVGSALAYRGIPLQSAYCAAKHAIQGFTESLRCELIHDQSNVKITMVQMPALNTPQFDWVKSRLPRKPQPVPPIYQPEVAADAIVHAAHHYRREWYVGGSTAIAITGNKIAPGLGDWYLGQQGYDAQQYDGHGDPDRPQQPRTSRSMRTRTSARTATSTTGPRRTASSSGRDQHRDWIALAGLAGGAVRRAAQRRRQVLARRAARPRPGALGLAALARRGRCRAPRLDERAGPPRRLPDCGPRARERTQCRPGSPRTMRQADAIASRGMVRRKRATAIFALTCAMSHRQEAPT